MVDVTQRDVDFISARFNFGAPVLRITPHGRGLINDTFRVELTDKPRAAILQRINTHVFKQPRQLIANLHALSVHAQQHVPPGGLIVPHLYAARDGQYYVEDPVLGFWRAQQFIPDTHTRHMLATAAQANSLGATLGGFHTLTGTLTTDQLHTTLPGFHVTPQYLNHFDTVTEKIESDEERACADFIESRREFAHTLERARERGELRLRPTHGDPKIDNFLFDASDRAVSLIDLDTVQPGLIHHDIGDCLRSACNRSGESLSAGTQAQFDVNIAAEILRGYVTTAGPSLSDQDIAYFYDAIRLIPFELGLRFFADHLAGDVYFKISRRGHNLQRAHAQFALTADIERQEAVLRDIIDKL